MKIRKKQIISQILIASLMLSTVFANWFPAEPMVIYGNITGINSGVLKIYDGNNTLLKSANISNGSYGTNKTFDITNKIILSEYSWALEFEIEGQDVAIDSVSSCHTSRLFQAWSLCSYNLYVWSHDENTLEELDIENSDTDLQEVLVFNNEIQISKTVVKDTMIISESQKESIFISDDTTILQQDATIGVPREIFQSGEVNIQLGNSKVSVHGWVEVPTNKSINFDKDIRICTATDLTSLSRVNIYYSQDNVIWTLDSAASNLAIENGQICFDTNHLTSFALGVTSRSSGWGSSRRPSNSIALPSPTLVQPLIPEITTPESIQETKIQGNIDKNGDVTIGSKTYIKNLRAFNDTMRKDIRLFGYDMIYLNNDSEYNRRITKKVVWIVKRIHSDSLKQTLLGFFDDVTITHGIYTYGDLSDEEKVLYKAKLKDDIADLEQAIQNIMTKDRILANQ